MAELKNSALEDENNGTEESETSDNEYLSDFTNPHQIQKKTLVELEILSGVIVVNTNQWLLMQEALAAWINMKFLKVISKVCFHSLLKQFYSVIHK